MLEFVRMFGILLGGCIRGFMFFFEALGFGFFYLVVVVRIFLTFGRIFYWFLRLVYYRVFCWFCSVLSFCVFLLFFYRVSNILKLVVCCFEVLWLTGFGWVVFLFLRFSVELRFFGVGLERLGWGV